MTYRTLGDGEWSSKSKPQKDGMWVHGIKCCDCGLEHIIQYQITNGRLRFRAWRKPKKRRKPCSNSR